MPNGFDDNLDPQVTAIIGELAYRDSALLVDEMCRGLESWVVKELVVAESDERRLFLQAYAKVVHDLRRKLKLKYNDLRKDTPRVLH